VCFCFYGRVVGVTAKKTISCQDRCVYVASACVPQNCRMQYTATHCNTLQHTATHRNTTAYLRIARYNTLHHTAPHCNTLQHTATHRNTLQHTTTHSNTLQHLQHTAIHYFAIAYPRTAGWGSSLRCGEFSPNASLADKMASN